MKNVHPSMRPFLQWFAPARASGNHLVSQNDEPEPGDARAALWARYREVHAQQIELLYGNRCPNGELMDQRAQAIEACEAELRKIRAELAE